MYCISDATTSQAEAAVIGVSTSSLTSTFKKRDEVDWGNGIEVTRTNEDHYQNAAVPENKVSTRKRNYFRQIKEK